jgi:hypothetical protein
MRAVLQPMRIVTQMCADLAYHGVVIHAAPEHGGSEHSCSGGAAISEGAQNVALAAVPSLDWHWTVLFRDPTPHVDEHADHCPSLTVYAEPTAPAAAAESHASVLHWIASGGASVVHSSAGTNVPSASEHACWRARIPPPQLTEHSPETSSTHAVAPTGRTGTFVGGAVAGSAVGAADGAVGGGVVHAVQRRAAGTTPWAAHS